MRRREFVTAIGGAAAAACPFMAGAQQSAMPVVGVVSGQSGPMPTRENPPHSTRSSGGRPRQRPKRVRRVIMFAMALIASGLLASLAMTQVWQLILLWGIVVGIGTGLTAMVLAATVATRWFNHRRGVVLGMPAASSATGQLVFLPLIAELTTRFGWRAALIFVSGMLAFVALVASLRLHHRPSDLNLPLDGESKITPRPAEGVGLAFLLPDALLNVLKERQKLFGDMGVYCAPLTMLLWLTARLTIS